MSAIKIIVITCLFACVSCKTLQDISSHQVESVLFSLKTTSCSGSCPVYEFYIYTNGKAKYVGEENTEMLGVYEAKANSQLKKNIDDNLQKVDYFKIKAKNNTLISDLPTKYFFYNDGEREHKVTYYYPKVESLDLLIGDIDSLVKSIKWKKEMNKN